MGKASSAEGTGSSPHEGQSLIRSQDEGVSALEYALIASLIALVIIVSVVALSGSVESLYSNISSHVSSSSS